METQETQKEPSRGFIGTGFKWMFILFNVMMLVIVYLSMGNTEESNTIVQLFAGMGIGMLVAMWVMGDIVLGAFSYFTRAKS